MRVSRLPLLLAVAVSLLGIGLAPSLALANCYETFGCTNSQYFDAAQLQQASCQILWEMRNWIYQENGYCFHSPKAS